MGYPIVNNSICELSFEGLLDGQQTISTFHYRVNDATSVTDGAAVLAEFISATRVAGKLFPSYQAICSDQLTNLQIWAQLVYPVRFRYTTDGTPSESGAQDLLAFPPNVQASITRAAEKAGRKYVSHLSVPSVPITAIESGMLSVAYMDDMQPLVAAITEPYVLAGGVTFTPVIYHRNQNPSFDDLVLAFVQPTSRVIRRRTVGLGS
jgi:hypothetical protein